MNILIRYAVTVLVLCLLGWTVCRFFSRHHRQVVHETVSLVAKILLLVAAFVLLRAAWQG